MNPPTSPTSDAPVIPAPNASAFAFMQQRANLLRAVLSGTNWFFWIAGLSLVNSLSYRFGFSFTFVVGLGLTQLIDGITVGLANEANASAGLDVSLAAGLIVHIIGFILTLLVAGFFIAIGLIARRGYTWVLIVGMVIYALDALLLLAFSDFLGVAFHAYALWNLFQAVRALNLLKKFDAEIQAQTPPPPSAPQGPVITSL